jgi:hypothetical protein
MKRIAALLALSAAFAVSACEDPRPVEDDAAEMTVETPMAPAVEDTAAPTDATAPTTPPPPTDATTIPPEKRTSEESVQPESETLFY